MMNAGAAETEISSWIAERSRRSPDKVAIRFEGLEITYGAMESRVARLAGALADRAAVADGDRVAYLGHNAPELLDALFACARLGAIFVPLSARMTARELAVVIAHNMPTVLIADAELEETAREAADGLEARIIPFGGHDAAGGLEALLDGAPERCYDPDRACKSALLIIHTSGTTGAPKGAVMTHDALRFGALNVAAATGMNAADEILANAPLSNTGPMNILTTPALAAGATVTIQRRFEPAAMLEEIERRAITLAISPPAMTKALSSDPRWGATDLSSLRCVITGSTTVHEDALAPWFERGVPACQAYGLTETMPVTTFVPIDDADRLRATAGRQVEHSRVRIATPDGESVEPGQQGEVLVCGPTVMREYWRNPDATRRAFHDDWFRTGDIGCLDDEGVLRIVGRIKEIIIVDGFNVSPADVEAVLAACPEIAEAAVIGRPDDEHGEVPVAFVVLRRSGSMNGDDVKRLFEGQLAPYRHPQEVIFLDALPRNAIGKVEKARLQDPKIRPRPARGQEAASRPREHPGA